MGKAARPPLRVAVPMVVLSGAYALYSFASPDVDRRAEERTGPVIQRHLEGGFLGEGMVGGRDFCDVRFVETREKARELLVGAHAACQEYDRRGAALKRGTGFSMPLLVTLHRDGDRYRVVKVRKPEDGAGFEPSVKKMFTWAGKRSVMGLEGKHDTKILDRRARESFGLPADAPVGESGSE